MLSYPRKVIFVLLFSFGITSPLTPTSKLQGIMEDVLLLLMQGENVLGICFNYTNREVSSILSTFPPNILFACCGNFILS